MHRLQMLQKIERTDQYRHVSFTNAPPPFTCNSSMRSGSGAQIAGGETDLTTCGSIREPYNLARDEDTRLRPATTPLTNLVRAYGAIVLRDRMLPVTLNRGMDSAGIEPAAFTLRT